MRSPGNFINGILDIRDREFGRLLLVSAYLLLVIACYTTTKAVRDSLFVTKIGPAQLPYMYLLIAGVMGVVSYVYSKTVNRIGLYRLIRVTSLIAISNLLIFWWVFKDESRVWFYVLYVWVSVFGAITASQLWLLATHVFDPREARRVFAWIGVGGILGGIVGGVLTKVAATRAGTESLLLCCAVMMSATLVLLERTVGFARGSTATLGASEASGSAALFKQVRQSRHLSMMVFLLGTAVIVQAFIDYEYKSLANQAFESKDGLTAFFGTITFYIGLFSLLFQIVLSSRLLKRFGVGWAILLLPACLLGASLIVAAHPVLWAAALLQLIDGGFSYSIHRSGMELLYLPVPAETRNAVKGFIDMFVDRMGRAVGGLLLLLLTAGLSFSISWLSIVACVFLVGWIGVALAVKREYLHAFRLALEKKTIEPEALQASVLDNAAVGTLLNTLSSNDEREVLYSLDLLSNTHPNRWRRHVQALIQHPSSAVRARTVAILAQWSDPSVTRDEFIHHPDYRTARIAAAVALGMQWTGSRRSCEFLNQLLRDSSREVVRQAIRTAGNVKYEDVIPLLIEKLADKHFRSDAREALLKFGDGVLQELIQRLSDDKEPLAVRVRIPKVLAYTGKQEAADALIGCLHRLEYDLEYPILKALNRMRTNSPQIQLNPDLVTAALRKERREYDRLHAVLRWLEDNQLNIPGLRGRNAEAVFSLLMKAIRERLEQKAERTCRILALIYPPEDIYSAYYSCKARPALRASALEFLDNIIDTELKETVIPLVEGVFDPQKTREAEAEGVEFISTEAVLESLMAGADPWLRTIATDLMGKLPELVLAGMQGETFDSERRRTLSDARR